MQRLTIKEIKNRLKEMNRFHPKAVGRDLHIECHSFTFKELAKIAILLNNDQIDSDKGCNTCGYGTIIIVRDIIAEYRIRKASKLHINKIPYGGEVCELANVEKYKTYNDLEEAKIDCEKLNCSIITRKINLSLLNDIVMRIYEYRNWK